MKATIRLANFGDLSAISGIYNDAVIHTIATFDTEPRTVEVQNSWFESHKERHPILVATLENKIIGWSSLTPWSERMAYADTVEISAYVHNEYQRQGIGFGLTRTIIEKAKVLGIHCIISRIAGENNASIKLHEKLGFNFIGTMREVGRKFDKLHDVHLYQLIVRASENNLKRQKEMQDEKKLAINSK